MPTARRGWARTYRFSHRQLSFGAGWRKRWQAWVLQMATTGACSFRGIRAATEALRVRFCKGSPCQIYCYGDDGKRRRQAAYATPALSLVKDCGKAGSSERIYSELGKMWAQTRKGLELLPPAQCHVPQESRTLEEDLEDIVLAKNTEIWSEL